MDIPTPAELVGKIEAFIARHDMAVTRFGRDAVGDPNLLSDLRDGKRLPGLAKLKRISDFIETRDAELSGGDHAQPDIPAPATSSAEKIVENSRQAVTHA